MLSKSFYVGSIYIAIFLIFVSFAESLFLNFLGYRASEITLLGIWISMHHALSLIWNGILSRYYFLKKYKWPFYSSLLVVFITIVGLILSIEQSKTNEISEVYIWSSLFSYSTIVLNGCALVFLTPKDKVVLKSIGVFYFVFGVVLILITIWIFTSLTALIDGYGFKLGQWNPMIFSFSAVLFIVQFVNEIRDIDFAYNKPLSVKVKGLFGVSFLIIILLVVQTFNETVVVLNSTEKTNSYEIKLADRFEEQVFLKEDKKLPFRFLKPNKYDSTKRYPLVVCLHGSSGRGVGNVKHVSKSLISSALSTDENRIKYPAFLLVPQCPPNSEWGGLGNLPEYNPLLIHAIYSFEQKFSIDTTRRYITGYSMGGYGVWDLISTNSKMFAAAVPICGAGNYKLAQNMIDIPIWAFHGANDRNVLVKGSRDIIESIRANGGDPRYTEYRNSAHNIWAKVNNNSQLLPWLFSQRRMEN